MLSLCINIDTKSPSLVKTSKQNLRLLDIWLMRICLASFKQRELKSEILFKKLWLLVKLSNEEGILEDEECEKANWHS